MKQSRAMSLVEATANVVVGYGVAVATQILIFPIFGLHTTLAQNLKMGAVFTVVSIARSIALRRLFEAKRLPKPQKIDLHKANNLCGNNGMRQTGPPEAKNSSRRTVDSTLTESRRAHRIESKGS